LEHIFSYIESHRVAPKLSKIVLNRIEYSVRDLPSVVRNYAWPTKERYASFTVN